METVFPGVTHDATVYSLPPHPPRTRWAGIQEMPNMPSSLSLSLCCSVHALTLGLFNLHPILSGGEALPTEACGHQHGVTHGLE